MQLNINTDAAVKFTNQLEKMRKHDLPVVIRGALNDAAMDVKTKTMPTKANEVFINRTKNFFKANSKVEFAKGLDVNSMKSIVGFYENKLVNQSTNFAIKDLEEQEKGGTINSKTFIPTIFARKGNTKKGLVKPNLRLKQIRNRLVDASKQEGKNEKEKYVKAAFLAGVGGFVLYNNMIWKINSVPFSRRKTKAVIIKRQGIYSVKKGRDINVRPTSFMHNASLQSVEKLESFFITRAKNQILKAKFK